jgi:hypothetical protein
MFSPFAFVDRITIPGGDPVKIKESLFLMLLYSNIRFWEAAGRQAQNAFTARPAAAGATVRLTFYPPVQPIFAVGLLTRSGAKLINLGTNARGVGWPRAIKATQG